MKKMENTLENKAKFFAQYWGQSVFRKLNWNLDARPNYPSWDVDEQSVREPELEFAYLELKYLQDIIDEDAIELGFETDTNKSSANYGMSPSGVFLDMVESYGMDFLTKQSDLLRSKGYAVPWMGLSVDDLIEYGWVRT